MLPLALISRSLSAQSLLLLATAIAGAALALRRPRFFWGLTLALAPLALDWATPVGGVHLTLPLEGMLLVGGIAFLVREREGVTPRRAQIGHPLTLIVVAQLTWVLMSAMLSTDLLVSSKFALVRVLYTLSFYALSLRLLDRGAAFARAFIALGAGFLPVIALALLRFAVNGFDPRSVYESAQPFFQNRVDLCAALALWLLPALALWRARAALELTPRLRVLLASEMLAAVAALAGLRGRAALGAIVIGMFFAWLATRRPPRFVAALLFLGVLGAAVLVADIVAYRSDVARPGSSRVVSGVRAELLRNPPFFDESFTERANRWGAAARMGHSRALTGFGPGTFEKRYALFQNPWETTPRTTWAGDEGDAHSEFMTALAEQGLPGLALLLTTFVVAFLTAARGARRANDRFFGLPAALAGSLAAFFVLNGPNSLFDVDKVVPLFWIACAAAVNFDLKSRPGATSGADH